LNVLAENVLWIVPDMTNVPFAGTWQGVNRLDNSPVERSKVQDVVELEPEEFIATLEKVVVLAHFTMRVKATGKVSRSQWVHVWKVDEGKISYMREYVDTLALSQAHSPAAHLEVAI
jgi:ketosteroid isomerase-like protein